MSKMKKLFNTPKKVVITLIITVAVLATVGTGTMFAACAIAKSSAIGAENAQNFAFADAGVDPVSAKGIKTSFDFELGQFVYEIEFSADGTEYEYWIKSSDGTILKKDIEIKSSVCSENRETVAPQTTTHSQPSKPSSEKPTKPAEQKKPTQVSQPTKATDNIQGATISLDKAKNIALSNAGISASEAKFIKQKLEYDDGVQVYDIEFVTDCYEYEYEINAKTGAIHDKSIEKREIVKPAPTQAITEKSGTYIGIDQAKSIAVAKAGLSMGDVKFKKAKLDREDGKVVYEIEFYKGHMEYECTVNALNGAVIEFDSEYDD